MEMNVSSTTSAYTSAAASYDGYEVDKDLATKIKEESAKAAETKTGKPSEEFLQEQAAIFERSEVKSFLGQFHRDTVTNINTLGQSLFYRYEDKQGYGDRNNASRELYSKSISDRAEFYKKAYADMYDEIERGYADGTRKTYVVDNGVKRLATKEEELNALEKEYANKTRSLAAQRKQEIDDELVRQGKIVLYREPTHKKNQSVIDAYEAQKPQRPKTPVDEEAKKFAKEVTFDSTDDLESKKMDFVNMLSQNMLDFSTLFKQSYSQAQPGGFDMAAFFANISQKQ